MKSNILSSGFESSDYTIYNCTQHKQQKNYLNRGWVIITHLSVWFRAGESSYKKTKQNKKKKNKKGEAKAYGTLIGH